MDFRDELPVMGEHLLPLFLRRHRDVQFHKGHLLLFENKVVIPGQVAKLMPPCRDPAKIIGIEANGLNYLCELVDVNGRKRQVKLHVSKLKPYHS